MPANPLAVMLIAPARLRDTLNEMTNCWFVIEIVADPARRHEVTNETEPLIVSTKPGCT